MNKTVIAGAAVLAAVSLAAPAQAITSSTEQYGPLVCSVLDKEPSVRGVLKVGIDLVGQGFTSQQAGEVLADSVTNDCPEYLPLLKKFIAVYG